MKRLTLALTFCLSVAATSAMAQGSGSHGFTQSEATSEPAAPTVPFNLRFISRLPTLMPEHVWGTGSAGFIVGQDWPNTMPVPEFSNPAHSLLSYSGFGSTGRMAEGTACTKSWKFCIRARSLAGDISTLWGQDADVNGAVGGPSRWLGLPSYEVTGKIGCNPPCVVCIYPTVAYCAPKGLLDLSAKRNARNYALAARRLAIALDAGNALPLLPLVNSEIRQPD